MMGRFWRPLRSILPLFSASFLEPSNDTSLELGYKTTTGIHKVQWGECTSYTEVISEEGWYHNLNFWGFSCILQWILICWWNIKFLSKMNPRYFHELLGHKMDPPSGERSRGGGLKVPWDLLKWKISVLECSTTRPNFSSKLVNTL